MHRLVLATGVLLMFTACGGKRVPVASPTGTPARVAPADSELEGLASYYAEPYHGRRTANGEVFDSYQELTAAHRTLPFNTVVKVTNQTNGREVEVRINDRGPFVNGRVIDLSLKAAREIDLVRAGLAPVKLKVLKEGGPASPSPPSPRPSTPTSAALYTIQVGAFESQVAAESLQKDLEQRYRDVTIQAFASTPVFYRVRVGRLVDLTSAEVLSKQLRGEKFEPFVVRLN
jgi:peptidoglycan lytic transglycosylase